MKIVTVKDLSFRYCETDKNALNSINLYINKGEFALIIGKSGSGKSTLLKLLDPFHAPKGKISGELIFNPSSLSDKTETAEQAVCSCDENVYDSLIRRLKRQGVKSEEILPRAAETASYFGIQKLLDRKMSELSGGQRQLVNLASAVLTNPELLLLDEPTAQLDPISASAFLKTVGKINRELGITVIMSEHRTEEVFSVCDRVIVMEDGAIICDTSPAAAGEQLKKRDIFAALPAPVKIYVEAGNEGSSPVTIREGRDWLRLAAKNADQSLIPKEYPTEENTLIELRDIRFRYRKNSPDVLNGLSLKINKGELFAIVGGNGTGKTTALSVICGINRPYCGKILVNGQTSYDKDIFAILPQNPLELFENGTVRENLTAAAKSEESLREAVELCELGELADREPQTLSGGELQRAALAKIILSGAGIILMDEPTKGTDAVFKLKFARILSRLKERGKTIVTVSHDIEFCAEYADRCGMFFDGRIVSVDSPRSFFKKAGFYTTAARRMAQGILPEAALNRDILIALGKIKAPPSEPPEKEESVKKRKYDPVRLIYALLFGILFFVTCYFYYNLSGIKGLIARAAGFLELGAAITFLLPKKEAVKTEKRRVKGTAPTAAVTVITAALTVFIGNKFFGERKYFFISVLIIAEAFLPLAVSFERKKPNVRELLVIAVMCAAAAAGRQLFYFAPQFKPMAALVIITGACFGAQAGFLTGAASVFVSNFFFGQGAWTPYQMFAFGVLGFLGGALFGTGIIRRSRLCLSVFGGLTVFIIYGLIMNTASVIMWQANPNFGMIAASVVSGIPSDFIHAASTVFFLWLISEPMIEKLLRIKDKYGI